ncbi:MAG TPA: hypothetical protein VHP35_12485, partial [Terriglobia bacterium]|nr:hypothetical protein [Terriglobia bacterium]
FPEDRCKIHVLAWGITEAQFEDIQRLRGNIYDLRNYFWQEQIAHACAHPLYSINDQLTLDHFEQLLVLFNTFETMNGGRNRRGNDLVLSVLETLDQAQLEELATRHRLAPNGRDPWIKGRTGGSDDHSGAFIAKGYTVCPDSATEREFLTHVLSGASVSGGLDGTPLSFAHSLYSIGYQYYRDRFFRAASNGEDLVLKTMGEVFGREQTQVRLKDRVFHYASKVARRTEKPSEIRFKQFISAETSRLFENEWLRDDFVDDPARFQALNRQTFELASTISNQLFFQFTKKFLKRLSKGNIFGSIEALWDPYCLEHLLTFFPSSTRTAISASWQK